MKAGLTITILASAVLGTGFFGLETASASVTTTRSLVTVQSALIEKVIYGCGRGWRPNRWGRCVPMYRRWGPRPGSGPPTPPPPPPPPPPPSW